MTIGLAEIGERLRAFRLGSGLSSDELAAQIGISRAALYRAEKGEIPKIGTLQRIADVLEVSLPTLLGVGVEYVASATAFFERMRQIEAASRRIVVLFGPMSYLLTSDAYDAALREVLVESLPDDLADRRGAVAGIDRLMEVLAARKAAYREKRPGVVSLIAASETERFLVNGLAGRSDLSPEVRRARRAVARAEVERIASLASEQPIGVQIGVLHETVPGTSFQIFRQADRSVLGISPFRLGEQPNVRVGVALITSAPEALQLHERIAEDLWDRAAKGAEAARFLERLMERTAQSAPWG